MDEKPLNDYLEESDESDDVKEENKESEEESVYYTYKQVRERS